MHKRENSKVLTQQFYSDTYAFCNIENAKYATLLFDKVYIHYDLSNQEIQRALKSYNADSLRFKFPKDIPLHTCSFSPTLHENMGMSKEEWYNLNMLRFIERQKRKGNLLIPISDHQFIAQTTHERTESIGFNACLEKIQIIDPKELSWEQIKEIRKDEYSLHGLRLLRSWVQDNMQNINSRQQANDKLEIAIQQYNNIIKKHGIITREGILEILFDWKTLAGITGVETAKQLFDLPHLSELLVGFWLTGRIFYKITQVNLKKYDSEERKDLERLEYLMKLSKKLSA